MEQPEKYTVTEKYSIRDAVTKMDEAGIGFCVCVNESDKVIGVITDGDFRHAVHRGIQLDDNVLKIVNKKFTSLQKGYNKEYAEEIFMKTIIRRIPILDQGKLIDIILKDKFYDVDKASKIRMLDKPVVIMAGGKGTRLDPFTRILPKPLIPLGNDPIIKVVMDEFNKFGITDFYISLNDKEKMVMAYFQDYKPGYRIEYIHEDQPLGTAGALKFLEGKMTDSFFVSNCDIIIHTNYCSFYDFHKKGGYGLTMIGSMRQYTVPYGVCDIDNKGMLRKMKEKPHFDFLVNTGMYLLEPEILKFIPDQMHYDMTDLIQRVQESGMKVGLFPVSEKSWIDIGELSEYKNVIKKLSFYNSPTFE